jgi:hypothetical protein
MGRKYTILYYTGIKCVSRETTDSLPKALWYLFIYKPKAKYAWKSLEIR